MRWSIRMIWPQCMGNHSTAKGKDQIICSRNRSLKSHLPDLGTFIIDLEYIFALLEGPRGQNPYCCIADLRVKCMKTKYFYQVFQLFHCKWHHFRRKSHRSIGDFMGVNSHMTGPDLEGPRGQNPISFTPISPTRHSANWATTRPAVPTLPSRAHLQD